MNENEELRKLIEKLNYNELVDILIEYTEQDKSFAKDFTNLIEVKLTNDGEENAREEVLDSFCQTRSSNN